MIRNIIQGLTKDLQDSIIMSKNVTIDELKGNVKKALQHFNIVPNGNYVREIEKGGIYDIS